MPVHKTDRSGTDGTVSAMGLLPVATFANHLECRDQYGSKHTRTLTSTNNAMTNDAIRIIRLGVMPSSLL